MADPEPLKPGPDAVDARAGSGRGLSAAERELVLVSAAVAVGDARRIAKRCEDAIAAGVEPAALHEALLQSYLFVGFPRAIEALFAAKAALERAGFRPGDRASTPANLEAWRHSGEALCRRVYGKNYAKLVKTIEELSPDLASWMVLEGYGKTLSRPALDPVTREYCVIAILTSTGMWRQLRSHAIGAVNVGGSRAGVREAIERCAPLAGDSVVREALQVVGMEPTHARR